MEERHIFKEPPSPEELLQMARLTPQGIRGLLSTRSRKYKELGAEVDAASDGELARLMSEEPGLLRRPLLTDGKRLVIGYDQAGLAAFAG